MCNGLCPLFFGTGGISDMIASAEVSEQYEKPTTGCSR